MENKKLLKRGFLAFALLVAVVMLSLVFYYKTILIGAGAYLAPERVGKADAAILQGGTLIDLKGVKICLNLLSSGRANFLVIVEQELEGEEIFALPDYPLLVAKNLEALGLKKRQFEIIGYSPKHPVTLTEAKIVISHLSGKGVRSAFLITEGFHTRRSYWAYRWAASPAGIEIIPCPYFSKYQKEMWWQQTEGIFQFFLESLKFIYYLVRGYLPLKSLFVT